MQSSSAVLARIARSRARISRVEFSHHGYWEVTYSVAPAVELTVTVCQNGIGPERAAELATPLLALITGQEVTL